MWWYNILGDNEGIISHILLIDTIYVGSVLITTNLVALKRENNDPILIVKRTEWVKFIDYFGLSIEADPSRVGKNNVYIFPCWLYNKPVIYKAPYIKLPNGKILYFVTTKYMYVPTNKEYLC